MKDTTEKHELASSYVTETLTAIDGLRRAEKSGRGYTRLVRESDNKVVAWVVDRETSGARVLYMGDMSSLEKALAGKLRASASYSSLIVQDDDAMQDALLVMARMLEATPVKVTTKPLGKKAAPGPSGKRARPRAEASA